MVVGLLLIVFGLLVALFPQILVAMISSLLILMGLGLCVTSFQWRRLRRASRDSSHWMLRF
jgi:uncharacterized protein YjeT (DUF2065 family)